MGAVPGRSTKPLDGMSMLEALEEKGYVVAPSILAPSEASSIQVALGKVPASSAGTRNLLELEWCRSLVARLRAAPSVRELLPGSSVAVQCTLFDKTPDRNWLVALHQDLSIPVSARVEHPQLGVWSVKEGQNLVQPPDGFMSTNVVPRMSRFA